MGTFLLYFVFAPFYFFTFIFLIHIGLLISTRNQEKDVLSLWDFMKSHQRDLLLKVVFRVYNFFAAAQYDYFQLQIVYSVEASGGGGFSLVEGVGVCAQVLGCLKSTILVYQWVSFRQRPMRQNWVHFSKIALKNRPISSNLGVFVRKWYIDGSQNRQFLGIEMVETSESKWAHTRIKNFEDPPGFC